MDDRPRHFLGSKNWRLQRSRCTVLLLIFAIAAMPACAADQAQLQWAQSIGPLQRGPSGEIELVAPKAETRDCPAAKNAGAAKAHAALNQPEPGHWMEIPNSRLATVVYNGPLARSIAGNTGPAAIMAAWSGGAFDAATQSLIVWGGGHQDYYGNEVYAFSLNALSWRMLDQPSSIAAWDKNTPVLPDSSPSAQHTYDGLAMLPDRKLFVAGSSAATPDGSNYRASWLFDLASGTWHRAADFVGSSYGNVAAYDATSGKVYAISTGTGLQAYDPTTDRWSGIGPRHIAKLNMTGAIDPKDGLLVAVGGGALHAIKLTLGIVSDISSTGDPTVVDGNAPGFVWDSSANLFVGWSGGGTVYTLDPRHWQWTAYRAAPDNPVTPTPPATNGTFGRLQYDERTKVFILVNSTQQDVYLYRDCFDEIEESHKN